MIEQGQSRRYVKDNVARIKQDFRWAVKQPVAAYVEKVYEEGDFSGLGV